MGAEVPPLGPRLHESEKPFWPKGAAEPRCCLTLLELMVVVAVIALVASIVVPALLRAERAKDQATGIVTPVKAEKE